MHLADSTSRHDLQLEPPVAAISTGGIVDAILQVGRERNLLLKQLRSALQSGRKDEALEIASKLCGLTNEKSNRANSSIN
jgi:hypothetical protein